MSKYKSRLPREDLKRFAKEVSKKLVSSDFKNKRVTDPTTITPKQERNVKKYVKDYFDKAVQKKADHDAKKKRESGSGDLSMIGEPIPTVISAKGEEDTAMSDGEGDAAMDLDDDDEDEPSPNNSTNGTKRKRDGEDTPLTPMDVDEDAQSAKKPRDAADVPLPPPPPPPPPAQDDGAGEADMEMDEEDQEGVEYGGEAGEQEKPGEQKGDGSESFTWEAREAVAQAGVSVR
jgi:hypothetical protein